MMSVTTEILGESPNLLKVRHALSVINAPKGGTNYEWFGSLFILFIHAKLSPKGVLVLVGFGR